MRIIYATDDNYAALTAISAVSALKHNPAAEIILLGYRLKEASVRLVESRVVAHGGAFRHIRVDEQIARIEQMNCSGYTSYAVYSRLFIADLLSDLHGRVLYLDCDTLVRGSLAPLFEIDLRGRPLALAQDATLPAYNRVIGIDISKPYFNTGVLLMDLDAWRAADCTGRLLDELAHPHGATPLPDQDIIARRLNDEVMPLDRKWNFLSQYFLTGLRETPIICHFSGHTLGRPWFTPSYHPLRGEYAEAAREADLLDAIGAPRKMESHYLLQFLLWKTLPGFLFRPLNRLMYRVFLRRFYGV